jgi:MFS transporter, Spinster family, sphingosine-1-phosphate transporter
MLQNAHGVQKEHSRNATHGMQRTWPLPAFLAFLTLLNVLNIADRHLLSTLAPLITKDLNIGLDTYGFIAGPVFITFYSIFVLIFGFLADRYHRPRLIALGLTLWSGLTALTGLTQTIWQVAAARLFVGIGESALAPAAISMIGDRFSLHRRGFAIGVYYTAIPLGVGLATAVGAFFAPRYGWRDSFILMGCLGLLLVPLLFFLKNPERQKPTLSNTANISIRKREILKILWKVPALGLVIIVGILTDFMLSSMSLINFFLIQDRGYSFQNATLIAGVMFLLAGIIGNICGGWLGDWIERRRQGGRLLLIGVSQAIGLPFALGFFLLPNSTPPLLLLLCGFILSLVMMLKFGPILSVIQELTPVHMRATAIAIFLVFIGLLGNGLGPYVAGVLATTASLKISMIICVCIGGLSVLPAFWAWQRYPKDLTAAQTLGA